MPTRSQSILIVDDDREIRESLSAYFEGSGWLAPNAASGREALERIRSDPPDAVVTDVRMPGMDGLALLGEIRQLAPHLPVLMITAHGDIPMAIEAMRQGAADFIEKPFDPQKIVDAASRSVETTELRRQNTQLRKQLGRLAGFDSVLIGECDQMQRVREEIVDIAEIDAAVMILGETGTGKEVVARALHDMSPRAGNAFIPVNCAAVPDGLFESIMFGHKEGAFTGATKSAKGAFSAAEGGTLFLDEIGTCPLNQQAKLLRVLDSSEVTTVGTTTPVPFDTRIISATNVDPKASIESGSFREDLYYRICTVTLHLPPLRERGDDIILLFATYLEHFSKVYRVEPPELTHDDIAALRSHGWPGNVRELGQVAERRMLTARRGQGSVRDALGDSGHHAQLAGNASLKQQMEAYERTLIAEALAQVPGTMDAVANHLGIGRRTLNEKLAKHGLSRD